MNFRRLLKRLIVFLIVIYVAICAFMAVRQRSLIYYPRVIPTKRVVALAFGARLTRWTNSTGELMGMKRLFKKSPTQGSVLIAYGNGSTAVGCADYVDAIQDVAPLDAYILEYPGYEDRPGTPSEKSIFDSAREALLAIPTNQPVYVLGQSLGTGIACYLAGTYSNRIAGILLISPFTSLDDAAFARYPFLPVSFLLWDHFHSEKYLRHYNGKVGVVVDGKDRVVPSELAQRLFRNYPGPKRKWEFPDSGHCELPDDAYAFWNEVINFWQADRIILPRPTANLKPERYNTQP